ncbi:hypothetical protein HD554DRAFT_2257734 [Boletus coccyginus]|nr:hypothetical protein HD554DRAFT_2257734 [Boletus coccyginus]
MGLLPVTIPPPERESTSLGLVNEILHAQLTNVKRISHADSSCPSAPCFPVDLTALRAWESIQKPQRLPTHLNSAQKRRPFLDPQSKEPSSTSAFSSQWIFLKVNQINRIEERLRLFTSVEVLDGDNTVRCHCYWKIAHGFYKPGAQGSIQDPDSSTDSEEVEAVSAKTDGRLVPDSVPASSDPVSPSRSTTSLQYTQISRDTPSTLTQPPTHVSSTYKYVPHALQLNDGYPIELLPPIRKHTLTQRTLVVPSISTTVPESPVSIQTAKPATIRSLTQTSTTTEYSSRISLSAPHRQHGFRTWDSNPESEVPEGESETMLSVYSDVSSAASSNPSPNASQDHLQQPSPTPGTHSKDKRHPSGVPRSRQFLLRPTYKRYFIATPPPIFVVHLKRF